MLSKILLSCSLLVVIIITSAHNGHAAIIVSCNNNEQDSSLIQNAIDNSPANSVVFIDSSECLISVQIRLKSDISIRGRTNEHTRLTLANNVNNNMFWGPNINNIKIEHIQLNGNKIGQTAGSGIVFRDSNSIIINDVTVDSFFGDGIIVESTATAYYLDIFHSVISNNGTHGISISDITYVTVRDNWVYNNGKSGINLSTVNFGVASNNLIWRILNDTQGYGGIRCSNTTTRTTISGNTIKNTSRGIFILSGSGYVTVSGNTINDSYMQGILIQASSNNVSGNTILNTGTAGINGSTAGIQVDNGAYNIVSNNTVTDNRSPEKIEYNILTSGSANSNSFVGNLNRGCRISNMSIGGANTINANNNNLGC